MTPITPIGSDALIPPGELFSEFFCDAVNHFCASIPVWGILYTEVTLAVKKKTFPSEI